MPGQHRTLYLREDRVLETIITALAVDTIGQRFPAGRVRDYLRDHEMVAVCGEQTVALERDSATATHRRRGC